MFTVSKKQKQEILALERRFAADIAVIKKKQLAIMKRYEQKRGRLMRQRISKKIANF